MIYLELSNKNIGKNSAPIDKSVVLYVNSNIVIILYYYFQSTKGEILLILASIPHKTISPDNKAIDFF